MKSGGGINEEKAAKDFEYFKNHFESNGPSFYAGIDCMKQLNETRKRKHNPEARYIDLSPSDPFNDRTGSLVCHIDSELAKKMLTFCSDNSISLQNLIYLGMRTYLSSVNELTDDVTFNFLSHGRKGRAERNCGGSLVTMMPLRTIIGKDTTFAEALNICKKEAFGLMRHIDAPPMKLMLMLDKIEHRRMGACTASTMFTVCPPQAFICPDGWEPYIQGVSTGFFPYPAYVGVLPCPADGGIICQYEYRVKRFTEENLKSLHLGMENTLKLGLENPEITIGEILQMI